MAVTMSSTSSRLVEGGIDSNGWIGFGAEAVEHFPDLSSFFRHCYAAVGSTGKALARKNTFMHQRGTINELVPPFPNLLLRLVAIKSSPDLQLEPRSPVQNIGP